MLPFTLLPPVFGTTLSDGPPTSASPSPPDVVIATSCALPTSAMYAETPPPLKAGPPLRPSSRRRPSLLCPPGPPITTLPASTWMADGPPVVPGMAVFGGAGGRSNEGRLQLDGISVGSAFNGGGEH